MRGALPFGKKWQSKESRQSVTTALYEEENR